MSEWHPIETAPKDGTRILILDQDWNQNLVVFVARWAPHGLHPDALGFWYEAHEERWCASQPSHWMPLPEPPEMPR